MAAAVEKIVPQPFLLRFGIFGGGFREHAPDFLAVFRDGSRWLFAVTSGDVQTGDVMVSWVDEGGQWRRAAEPAFAVGLGDAGLEVPGGRSPLFCRGLYDAERIADRSVP